ncbi:antiviral innate immune response receptor RIG-I-like isoform X2 [Dreissena polymorpha]|uniref:antiviral innate immune response receptor RIG-I-like isoform X2 n=1 Tax=Dreissena polymorpha TaxID=45954 RepID=UPI002264F14C|nr:antiviral innate immune response receptor RIG-I-like isoform X2 [Dreissena polymorpha]
MPLRCQVVGLTASLGVGGSTDPAMGLKHMKSILANMDAKFLCTVRYAENKRELLKHTNCPIEEPVRVPHRVNDRFREAVSGVVRQIDNHILESCNILDDTTRAKCSIPLAHFGTERYSQWNAEFVKNTMPGIRIDPVRRILNPCRLHLEAYNKALMIHQDARIIDAIRLLKECMDKLRRPDIHDTDATLVKLYDGLSDSFVDQPENPKLVKMGEILQDVLVADENARGIIFVKTRELAKALVRWINESNTLTILNAWELVGKNAATSKGGMTKYKQMNVLKYFDDGRHRVIVATSVAEEGLDIRKCNLVIRYEHVTNEIVRLQSRGRARADFSRYLVISSDPAILEKEEKNRRCEELMNRIVPQLQEFIDANGNLWEKELLQIQKEMKEQRAREKENKRRNMLGDLEFQCLNCGAYICLSSDIKCFNKDHHIITHPDINERIRMESGFVNFQEPEGMEYGGQIFCAEITCQENLGSICTLKNAEFPLVTLKAFRVEKPDGTGRSYKRWKEVPCEIAEITVDGLSDAVDARLNYLV